MAFCPVPFIILCQGRSGSTWLVDMLNSHPAACVKGEALVNLALVGAADQLAWVRAYLAKERSGTCRAVGFKSKLTDVLDCHGLGEVLRDASCRVLHLDRVNLVKQTVSWMRADLLFAARRVHNVRRPSEVLPRSALDPEVFEKRLAELSAGRRALAAYVGGLDLQTCRVAYESLVEAPDAEFARILRFLDLEIHELRSGYTKNTAEDLSVHVSNLAELRSHVHDARMHRMFDGQAELDFVEETT